MIKSKKLSSLVAASLILAGGSLLGVQTVSADTESRLSAVETLASQNSTSIKELTEKVNNISTTPGQLQQIDTNNADIATNKTAIADEAKARADKDTAHDTAIAANKKAIEDEAAARVTADQTESTARDEADKAEAKARADKDTEHDKAIAANKTDIAANTDAINKEVQDRTKAVADEATARADKDTAHDKAIAANKDAINKEVQDRTKAVADEAKARADKDTEHDTAIAANKKAIGDEAAARESGDNALQNQIKKESAARQADISRLDNKIHDVSKEVDTVGALSMAMSGLHPLSYDEGDARFQLSAAVGTYDGTEALALGGFYHFNRDSMLSVGVATDLGADEHRMGANVGYTRRIGQGGHVSRPSEGTVSDIMKDIKNLEQKQAKLEQENEQLKKQLASLKK